MSLAWQVAALIDKQSGPLEDFIAEDKKTGSKYTEWHQERPRDGHTAFTHAIKLGRLDIVKYIVETHPGIENEENDFFGMPRDYAEREKQVEIADFLKSIGATLRGGPAPKPTPKYTASQFAAAAAAPAAPSPFDIAESEVDGAFKMMIVVREEELVVKCVTVRGQTVLKTLEITDGELSGLIKGIPGNPCKNQIGAVFMQSALRENTHFFVMYRGDVDKEIYPYGFIFAKPEGTGYFLDLICATKHGADLLKFFIKWCTSKRASHIHLHALPHVMGLYTKFGFQFRRGCADPAIPDTKEFKAKVAAAGKVFPSSVPDVWNNEDFKYVQDMVMVLQKKGFSAYESAPAECFEDDLTPETFKTHKCDQEGYTMVRCRAPTRKNTRKQKRRQTRKKPQKKSK
jgi:hypothetical protein